MGRPYTKKSDSYYPLGWGIWYGPTKGSKQTVLQLATNSLMPKQVSGETLPNFKTLIASGLSATTPLNAFERSCVRNYSPRTLTYHGSSGLWYNSVWYGFSDELARSDSGVTASMATAAEAKAKTKLVQYARERQTPFAAQVFLGETKEILSLLKNPLNQSLKLIKALRAKTNTRAGKAFAKEAAASWLEFRFAILPLIQEINVLIEIYNDSLERVERNKFYSETTSLSMDTPQLKDCATYTAKVQTTTENRAECIIRCGVIFEKLEKHRGLKDYLEKALGDISQVVPTIYELTPNSFLLDYFVNVGDILSAATLTNVGFNYVSFTTIKTTTVKQRGFDIVAKAGYGIIEKNAYFGDAAEYTVRYRSVKRVENSSIVPPLVFTIPSSGIRLANLTALLTLQLTK